jgi:hypothetical protein
MTIPLDHSTADWAVDAAIDRRRRRPTGVLTGEVADATAIHPAHAVEDVAVRRRARPRVRRLGRPRASEGLAECKEWSLPKAECLARRPSTGSAPRMGEGS